MRAYVFVNVDPGKAAEVVKKISKIKGVKFAEAVTGPFDIVAMAEADNLRALGQLVVSKIQKVAGVKGTMTNPVVEF